MTPEQLQILQHTLGLDQYGRYPTRGREECRRNHFVTGEDSPNAVICEELVTQGLMFKPKIHPDLTGGTPYYYAVTDAGKKVVREESPAPPKISRGKQNYLDWLSVSDVIDMSFSEWIKGGRKRLMEERRGW